MKPQGKQRGFATGKHSLYVSDGLSEEPKAEFQSYLTRVYKDRSTGKIAPAITIPTGIIKKLGLQHHDTILVAVRKATREDVMNYQAPVKKKLKQRTELKRGSLNDGGR